VNTEHKNHLDLDPLKKTGTPPIGMTSMRFPRFLGVDIRWRSQSDSNRICVDDDDFL
jgi:hypothetical protein